uniref:Uncharacterized protein n=1 Tax=Arundo donax TaxID=35708 RepID=A0A0A9EES9_ARUDO
MLRKGICLLASFPPPRLIVMFPFPQMELGTKIFVNRLFSSIFS